MKISGGCLGMMVRWGISALLVLLCAWVIPGIELSGFGNALWLCVILGLLNAFIKPIMIVLTIRVTLFSFGAFVLVINGLLVWLAGGMLDSFYVDGFWAAFFFGVIYGLFRLILFKISENK